ncbi:hypothetical protein, partial [Polaromonas glacialis]|uniref:hypothetical protein n=1 Tax=Polaromonas glacialis TaxID=866564 RepID=UPI001E4DE67C
MQQRPMDCPGSSPGQARQARNDSHLKPALLQFPLPLHLHDFSRKLSRGTQCRHHEPAIQRFFANADHTGVIGKICVYARIVIEK